MYKALNYWVFGGFDGQKTPYEFIDWAAAKKLDGIELTVGDALSIDISEEECKDVEAIKRGIFEKYPSEHQRNCFCMRLF